MRQSKMLSSVPTADSASRSFSLLLRNQDLRDELLPLLSDAEAMQVEQLLPEVWTSTREWLSRYPFLNRDTLLPASILKIAQLPSLPVQDIVTAVLWELWVFAVDDLFDEGQSDFSELCALSEEFERIAIAPPGHERAQCPFGEALLDIKQRLASHATFRDLHPAYASTLSRLLNGYFHAYRLRAATREADALALPSFDEYLYQASRTFLHPFMWSLPLYNDDTVTTNLPALAQLADQCSRVLRLSNDLGTWAREEREGVLNAVSLEVAHLERQERGHSDSDRHTRALTRVRERLRRERPGAYELRGAVLTNSRVEEGFIRLMELGSAMYERQDLRELQGLVTGRSSIQQD